MATAGGAPGRPARADGVYSSAPVFPRHGPCVRELPAVLEAATAGVRLRRAQRATARAPDATGPPGSRSAVGGTGRGACVAPHWLPMGDPGWLCLGDR